MSRGTATLASERENCPRCGRPSAIILGVCSECGARLEGVEPRASRIRGRIFDFDDLDDLFFIEPALLVVIVIGLIGLAALVAKLLL